MPRFSFAAAAILALVACSSSSGPPTITITGMTWGPANLTVAAGDTITVINNDPASPHTVTSEPFAGSYDAGVAANGFDFNSHLVFYDGGVKTIVIPADIPSGTVLPYFCEIHGNMMIPPDQTITVK